jgi:hypothetical protein
LDLLSADEAAKEEPEVYDERAKRIGFDVEGVAY